MGKAGWQIATAVCGSLALMMGALAFNTSKALDVANAQLREPEPVAVYATNDSRNGVPLPSNERCIDGTAYMRVESAYLSRADDGELISAPCAFVAPR